MFEKIKRFYDLGLYSETQIRNLYKKGILTKEEYEKICEQ